MIQTIANQLPAVELVVAAYLLGVALVGLGAAIAYGVATAANAHSPTQDDSKVMLKTALAWPLIGLELVLVGLSLVALVLGLLVSFPVRFLLAWRRRGE